MKRVGPLAVAVITLFAGAASMFGAALSYAESPPVCEFPLELASAGLLPPSETDVSSLSAILCGAWGSDAMVSPVLSLWSPPTPPAVPSPGVGRLHLVTDKLTRGVSQTSSGEVISLGSLTITITQSSLGYSLDVAFLLSSSAGTSVTDCDQALSGGQPWQIAYPSALGSGAFDYPSSALFLQQLADAGYIDTSAIDLTTAPDASWPMNLWTKQPTFRNVLGSAAPAGIGSARVPGDLYVNLDLSANQGDTQWQVSEWNYAFALDARLAAVCPRPTTPTPQPQPNLCPKGSIRTGQPVPADGDCNSPPPCATGLSPRPDGSCGGKPNNNGQPTCVSGPRAGEVPPTDVSMTQWCATPAPVIVGTSPCSSPGTCPAILTCGGDISCPLLAQPGDRLNPGGGGP